MRTKLQAVILISLMGMMIISSGMVVWGEDTPELEQGGWDRPEIDNVELEIKNSTGIFKFTLDANGSAPEGTERVEVTFGGLNGTNIEVAEDFWFEEGTVFLFIYGSTLEQEEGPYAWSNWSFDVWFSMSANGGIEGAISQIGSMFGVETGNISTENFDLANLTTALAETKLYFIARSYNETGAWGQEAFDISDHFYTAILQFMIDEGMLEDPFADDDDEVPIETEEEGKKKSGLSPLVLIAIFVIGIVSLLVVVAIVVFLALSSKRKSQ